MQALTFSVPVPKAWLFAQLTQCRAVRASFASAQVRTKLDGRFCCWPEQPTTTVLPAWFSVSDADTVVPIWAGAQPAKKPRTSRMTVKAAAGRPGEGFMVPPRIAHHNVRRGRGGDGWENAAGRDGWGRRGGGADRGKVSGVARVGRSGGEGCTVRL